jgi:glutaredoxin 2
MEVTVYEMEHSPFCIPVTQVLTALGIGFERVAVPNWDRSIVIEVTGGSYYQVPVLKHGDKVIADPALILRTSRTTSTRHSQVADCLQKQIPACRRS